MSISTSSGGVKLDSLGLDDDPIIEVKGGVRFEAAIVNLPDGTSGFRFELNFNGTLKVIELGNLGSTAGLFILDMVTGPGASNDAVTVGELFSDLGLPINLGDGIAGIELPKFWGVMTITTNLAFLQNLGIDAQTSATLQINTTREDKVETLRLEGIPGDILAKLNGNAATIAYQEAFASQLGNEVIPDAISTLFAESGITLSDDIEVFETVGGTLWRIEDNMTGDQYFLERANISDLDNPESEEIVMSIRGETQEYTLEAKALLIAGYARMTFEFPPQSGNKIFIAQGSFSVKVSVTEFEFFVNGEMIIGPTNNPIFTARAQALFYADPTSFNYAGNFIVSTKLDLPGVTLAGSVEIYFNTSFEDIVYEVPDFIQSAVGFESFTIPAGVPFLDGSIGDPAIYFVLNLSGSIEVFDLFSFSGEFQLVLEIDAINIEIDAEIDIGIAQMAATGTLSINQEGVFGSVALAASVGTSGIGSDFFLLSGQFQLEFNGTSREQTITTIDISDEGVVNGLKESEVGANTFRIVVGGTLKIIEVIDFSGRFEMAFIDGGFLVGVSADVNILDIIEFEFDEELFIPRIAIPAVVINESVDIDLDLGGLLDSDMTFTFQVNTGFEESRGVAAQTFLIGMSGSLSVFDFLHMQGDYQLTLSATQYRVNVNTGIPSVVGTALGSVVAPIVDAMLALEGTSISEDLGEITGMNVYALTLAASNVKAFVGLGSPDMDQPLTDQDLLGFGLEDLDLGLGFFMPASVPFFPAMIAGYASATGFEFIGGGDMMTLEVGNIEFYLNSGQIWPVPTNIDPPTIDFPSSFQIESDSNGNGEVDEIEDLNGNGVLDTVAGFQAPTGGDPVSFLMSGDNRIGVSISDVTMRLFDFIHFHGNFSFELGGIHDLTFNTGVGGDMGNLLGAIGLSDVVNTLTGILGAEVASDFSTISGLEYRSMTIGGSDISGFVGLGTPDFSQPFVDQDLYGFGLDDLDFGMAVFMNNIPSTAALAAIYPNSQIILLEQMRATLPYFFAMDVEVGSVGTYGFGDIFTIRVEDVRIQMNMGTPLFGITTGFSLANLPSIDFVKTFGTEDANGNDILDEGEDIDQDGFLDTGFEVATGADPIFIDFTEVIIGLEIGYAEISIAEFVQLYGSFAFYLGPTYDLDVEFGGGGISGGTYEFAYSFGGSDIIGFVGLGGYEDINGDGRITDVDAIADNSLGFFLDDLDFGLALFQTTTIGAIFGLPQAYFLALDLSARSVGFTGAGKA